MRGTCARSRNGWVERQLRLIPGCGRPSSVSGGLIKQYEVNPNLGKLRDYKVTLQQLFSALQRGNSNVGGRLPRTGQGSNISSAEIGLLRSSDEIGSIVRRRAGAAVPILVKYVANVSVGSIPRQGIVDRTMKTDGPVHRHRADAKGRKTHRKYSRR